MRAKRAFVILTAHLLFLGLVILVSYWIFRSSGVSAASLGGRRLFGKVAFGIIVILELIMISFVSPALTSNAISAEREHHTYDLLRATILPPRALVGGKYLAGLIFIFLLIFTALPFSSPAMLFGGVLPEEIAISILVLVFTAITFSAVGLFFSSVLKRTLVSTVLSYAFSIFMVFGIPIIALVSLALFGSMSIDFDPSEFSLQTQVVLIYIGWLIMSISPLATIIGAEVILLEQQSPWMALIEINADLTLKIPSPWIGYLILSLTLSLILLWISTQLVNRIDS
jgi:ABC-type transport system involved in multi-copper enzyme maturation permease subunit